MRRCGHSGNCPPGDRCRRRICRRGGAAPETVIYSLLSRPWPRTVSRLCPHASFRRASATDVRAEWVWTGFPLFDRSITPLSARGARTWLPRAPVFRLDEGTRMSNPISFRGLESLEARRLFDVSLAESEPNAGPADANPVPRVLATPVHISGAIDAPGDLDWFRIALQRGDIIGASVRGAPGLDGMIHFGNSAGQLLMHNDDSFFTGQRLLPAESPLPRTADDDRDPEVYDVITESGTYYFQVSAFTDED